MKKLLTTTAILFASLAGSAVAAERTVHTGTVTLDTGQTITCTYSGYPEGADCRALTTDAADVISLIERYGASRADFTLSATYEGRPIFTNARRSAQKRADGTYLMTGHSQTGDWGHVCTAEPVACSPWEAGTANTKAKATKKAKAKAAKKQAAKRA